MSSKGDGILVFTKGSNPDLVKTRLHPFVTPRQRLELHLTFLHDILEKIKKLPYPAYLFVMGDSNFPFHYNLPVYPQEGNDLGSRMKNAFAAIFNQHDRAIVIGTDSPDLPVERIQKAFEKLHEVDVVLGPTEDGGYYLLGLARMIPEIFEDIDWGTDKVLQQTLQRAANYKVDSLETHYDVDVIEDLVRLKKELQMNGAIAPHTKDWLTKNFKLNDKLQNGLE